MFKGFNRNEILKAKYREKIESWDWDGLKRDLREKGYIDEEYQSLFLGTVFSLTPSGKYYTEWTLNQNKHDTERDRAFFEALKEKAEKDDMFIENGEDPCDILLVHTLK